MSHSTLMDICESLDEDDTEVFLYLCRDFLKGQENFQSAREAFAFLADHGCLSSANQMEILYKVGRLDLIKRIFGCTWTPDAAPKYYGPVCSPFRSTICLVNDFLSGKEVAQLYFLCKHNVKNHGDPEARKTFLNLASLLEDLELLVPGKLFFLRHLLKTIGRWDLVKNLQV
nr:apoptosis regulator E8 [Equid gammaherpesvirus 5]UTK45597.1 apoptosis regulator E8 [Equid gammaherpesvirus 5]UTK45676.1 apoptosis regulator E8 [Equid gammaherpesvirus 5]UTK45755.1 apoptosis regulator E8 [Equid gammaherpesvirus 5]